MNCSSNNSVNLTNAALTIRSHMQHTDDSVYIKFKAGNLICGDRSRNGGYLGEEECDWDSADGAGCFRDGDDSLLSGLGGGPWLCLL